MRRGRNTIRMRLIRASLLLLAASLLLVLLVSGAFMGDVIQEKTAPLDAALAARINQNITFVLQASDYTYQSMNLNREFLEALAQLEGAPQLSEAAGVEDTISRALFQFATLNTEYIQDMALLCPDRMFGSSTNLFRSIADYGAFYRGVSLPGDEPVSLLLLTEDTAGMSRDVAYLHGRAVVVRPLYDAKGNMLAQAMFVLRPEVTERLLENVHIAIYDSAGRRLFSNLEDALLERLPSPDAPVEQTITQDGTTYRIHVERLDEYGWSILNLVDMSWFDALVSQTVRDIVVIAAVMAGVILALTLVLSAALNRRIQRVLKGFSGAVEGELSHIEPQQPSHFWGRMWAKVSFRRRIGLYFICTVLLPPLLVSALSYARMESHITGHNVRLAGQIAQIDTQNLTNASIEYERVALLVSESPAVRGLLYARLTGKMVTDPQYASVAYDITAATSGLRGQPLSVKLIGMDGQVLYRHGNQYQLQLRDARTNVRPTWYLLWDRGRAFLDVVCHSYGYGDLWLPLGDCEVIFPVDNLLALLPSAGTNIEYTIRDAQGNWVGGSAALDAATHIWALPAIPAGLVVTLGYNARVFAASQWLLAALYAAIAAVFGLLAALCARRLGRRIIRPVSELNALYAKIETSDFTVHYEQYGRDELDVLIDGFNSMVDRLNVLVREVYTRQIAEKQLQLDALQAQINPHFLYNTLETINALVELGDVRATQMVTLLSDFFRLGGQYRTALITLHDELAYTMVYVRIMQIRVGDRISFSLPRPEDYRHLYTLRLVLQPVIENSIKHGLRGVPQGTIAVRILEVEETLEIVVRDDGAGMDAGQLAYLHGKLAGTLSGGGIGLKNVHDRLVLQFGEGYGLHVDSEVGAGTTVTIRVPVVRQP